MGFSFSQNAFAGTDPLNKIRTAKAREKCTKTTVAWTRADIAEGCSVGTREGAEIPPIESHKHRRLRRLYST